MQCICVSTLVIGIIAVILTRVAIVNMSTTRTAQDGDSADSAAESEPPASASEAVARSAGSRFATTSQPMVGTKMFRKDLHSWCTLVNEDPTSDVEGSKKGNSFQYDIRLGMIFWPRREEVNNLLVPLQIRYRRKVKWNDVELQMASDSLACAYDCVVVLQDGTLQYFQLHPYLPIDVMKGDLLLVAMTFKSPFSEMCVDFFQGR